MLTRFSACDDDRRARRRSWALGLGLTACFSLGCPGVEPSAAAEGGAGAGGAPSSSSSSSSGKGGEGEGGGEVSSTSGTGGAGGGDCEADTLTDVKNCGACGRACRVDARVTEPRCEGGVCTSFCASGYVNMNRPATGDDDGCETQGRRVFVTSQASTVGDIGGVDGADERCRTLADAQELGGEWRAWLSGEQGSTSPTARFQKLPEAPYLRLDGEEVAASWAALTSGMTPGNILSNPINLTEAGAIPAGAPTAVWTGTSTAGTPVTGATCLSWESNNQSATAAVGDYTQVSEAWTRSPSNASCAATQARLYCFEQ